MSRVDVFFQRIFFLSRSRFYACVGTGMADITSRFYAYMGKPAVGMTSDSSNSRIGDIQNFATGIFHKLDSVNSTNIYEVQSEIEALEESVGDLGIADNEVSQHCRSIVEILYMKLRETLSRIQDRDLIELRRQINMTDYFKPKGMSGVVKWTHEVKGGDREGEKYQSSPSVVPELEKEAEILLATYQTNLDEIVTVRSRIAETSALMSMLSSKAVEQMNLADSILTVANDSIEYIEKADSQLHKAIAHNSSYRFYIVMWFMTLSFILLILDFIK